MSTCRPYPTNIPAARPRIAILLAVLAACAVLVPQALAQSWYVQTAVKPELRTGPGSQYRILAFVDVGERVAAVLEENEEWFHIRLTDGKDGWMRKRYLTSAKPSNLLLEELKMRHANLETRAARLEEENRQLKAQNEQMTTSIGSKTSAFDNLTRDFDALKKDADAKRFQMRKYLVFFFSGAGILFIGILLGMVMKRQRRRSSYMV